MHYHLPEAGQVLLVWGVDEWAPLAEELWPPETTLSEGIMHTPMIRSGDQFVVDVQVPALASLAYGFLVTARADGTPVELWDGQGHAIATEGLIVDVQAGLTFVGDHAVAVIDPDSLVKHTIQYLAPQVGKVTLVWGINGWLVLPQEAHPPRTRLLNGQMHTPMSQEGSLYAVEITAPAGATVDYGFLTTETVQGVAVDIWDANGEQESGYHTTVGADGATEIWAPASMTARMVEADQDQIRTRAGLLLATVGCLIASILFTGIWVACHPRGSRAKNVTPSSPERRWTFNYDLLKELVIRDTKLRYRRSVLGILWSLLNPLAYMLVFTFLTRRVLAFNIPNYPAFVFVGTLAWTWLQNSVTMSATSITGNRDLVARPTFPTASLPVIMVTSNLIQFLLALVVPLAYFVGRGGRPTFAMLMLPLVIVPQFMISVGLSYLVATFQVTFRDTQHLLGVLFRLLYFLTPIFYDASMVPERYEAFYRLNPMFHLITAYRAILLDGRAPDVIALLVLGLMGAILLWAGHVIFGRSSPRFVEEI